MRCKRPILGWRWLGAALCCVALAAHGGAILYKWVDADGVTHYSDRPEPGSQKIKVPSAQTYKGGGTTQSSADSRAQPKAAAPGKSYTRLEITNPEDGAVLWNTGGHIEIAAALEPELVNGHELWFVVDGKSQQASAEGTASVEVVRGSHTVVASVTDPAGQELITSAPVNFVVKQTSIAQPPSGPQVNPLPKPKPGPKP
ncbi:MAG TPA: DUF4124 domain-containing protein [Steroidobacteraceae bacterium]|nr:DUF4124 domain-containing protein [Steroidobacteraceae bacterium]